MQSLLHKEAKSASSPFGTWTAGLHHGGRPSRGAICVQNHHLPCELNCYERREIQLLSFVDVLWPP